MLNILIAILLFACGNAWGETTQTVATGGGFTRNQNAVYLTARNATTAGNAYDKHAVLTAGQSSTNIIWRSFVGIPIVDLSTETVSACTLYVHGNIDASSVDFSVNVFGGNSARSVIDTGDIDAFDGWATSGAYTGTNLINNWDSSMYSAGWNALVFNASGIDSVEAASGDTLWVAVLSYEDVAASAPSSDEYIQFEGIGTATTEYKPYLSYTHASGWSGTVSGVENPATVWGVDKAEIQSVWGVE